MPLCNGVRPLIEDMPHKDDGNVEIYTSNTTAPILSMLNKVIAEPEVLRNDLENSMMRKGLLTAFGRKQLLDAVYGIEPDPSDYRNKRTGFTGRASDKDRFFRHHLGNKVLRCWVPGKRVKKGAGLHYANEGNATAYAFADVEEEDAKDSSILGQGPATVKEPAPAWMGAELRRVGKFDPLSPDKRGMWKMAAAPLPGIELKDGTMPEGFFTFGPNDAHLKTPVSSPVKGVAGKVRALGADVSKTVRVDQMMMDLRIRPSQAFAVIREVIKVVFEAETVRVDKFHFSLGELVGIARHGELFQIPHHTNEEERYTHALRALCAKHLDLLLRSQVREDFQDLTSFPHWKKEYCELMVRVMQSMPDWQLRAVQIFWTLNRKIVMLRGEVDTKGQGYQAKRKDVNIFAEVRLINSLPEYTQLEQEVRKSKLDAEMYDRLIIMHKRERQHLRAEMDLRFEGVLLSRRSDAAADDQDRLALAPQQEKQRPKEKDKSSETARQTASASPAGGPAVNKAVMIEAAPAATLQDRKRKPLEGITQAELLDMPSYWYDGRLAMGQGPKDDKLSLKMTKALKDMMRDKEEFHFERGKKGEQIMTSQMLAYKTLNRKRGNMSAQNSLGFVSMVQQNAGVVPGRIVDEDSMKGASRGACSYRLVPSFEKHDKKPTHHPTSRPPTSSIKSLTQFFEIQEVLKKPSVDGRGKSLKLGAPIGIHRTPTNTPRDQRFRIASRAKEGVGTRSSADAGPLSSHAAVSPFPAEALSPGATLDDTTSNGSRLTSAACSPPLSPTPHAASASLGTRPASPSIYKNSALPQEHID